MVTALVMSALDPETGLEGYIWGCPPVLRRRLGEQAIGGDALAALVPLLCLNPAIKGCYE